MQGWFGQNEAEGQSFGKEFGPRDWNKPGRKRWNPVLGGFSFPCWIESDGRGCLQPLKERRYAEGGPVYNFAGPAVVYPLDRAKAAPLEHAAGEADGGRPGAHDVGRRAVPVHPRPGRAEAELAGRRHLLRAGRDQRHLQGRHPIAEAGGNRRATGCRRGVHQQRPRADRPVRAVRPRDERATWSSRNAAIRASARVLRRVAGDHQAARPDVRGEKGADPHARIRPADVRKTSGRSC